MCKRILTLTNIARIRFFTVMLLLLALSTHNVKAGGSNRVALLVTTFNSNVYSQAGAPMSCIISNYSKTGSQRYRCVDHISLPNNRRASILKTYGSTRRIILVAENTTDGYYLPVELNNQGYFVHNHDAVKLSENGMQTAFASERYIIGADNADHSVFSIQQDKSGDLHIVSTRKLTPLHEPAAEPVLLDAEPVSTSGEFLVSEGYITTGSAVKTVLQMFRIDPEGVIRENSQNNLTLDGTTRIVSDLSRNLLYVQTDPFWTGPPKIHQFRILPGGKLLEIGLKASAFGDAGQEADTPAATKDLKEVFPAPPVKIQPNPITVQSLKLCSRHNLLFGFGGVGMNEIYVWSIGNCGIRHLLNRYHLKNDVLVRGATQATNDEGKLPALNPLDSYFDDNDDLYVVRKDYAKKSQVVYKFRISNNGQLRSLSPDIPVETDRMIADMKFVQY